MRASHGVMHSLALEMVMKLKKLFSLLINNFKTEIKSKATYIGFMFLSRTLTKISLLSSSLSYILISTAACSIVFLHCVSKSI
jgi:hypothetical protein